MADLSDIETALVQTIGGVLYPQGSTAPSVVGVLCRIYRGWPNAAGLDADLAAGYVNVTVFPEARVQENTTRWPSEFETTGASVPDLTISVRGTSATVTGSARLGQVAGILCDNVAVVHRMAAGDTPALVAAVLAQRLRTVRIVQLSGATLTVPGAGQIIGRVVADQPAQRQTRRQRQRFRVSCWCPAPGTRDVISATVDRALSLGDFIALPDGTAGRVRFTGTSVFDQSEDAALYRRDLLYSVEYATTVDTMLPSMIFGDATLAPNGAGIVQSLLG